MIADQIFKKFFSHLVINQCNTIFFFAVTMLQQFYKLNCFINLFIIPIMHKSMINIIAKKHF